MCRYNKCVTIRPYRAERSGSIYGYGWGRQVAGILKEAGRYLVKSERGPATELA